MRMRGPPGLKGPQGLCFLMDAKKWVPRPGEAVPGTPATWSPAWALISSWLASYV